jgi:hypothetical protein
MRGDLAEARAMLQRFGELAKSDEVQTRSIHAWQSAIVARAEGRPEEALRHAEKTLAGQATMGLQHGATKGALVEMVEAALSLRDLAKAEALVGDIEQRRPHELAASTRAHRARLRARIDAAKGQPDDVDERFRTAAQGFRDIPMPFWLAVTLTEHGEWLIDQRRAEEAEPLLAEALAVFERLKAGPWIERVGAASARLAGQPASAAPA